MYIAEFLPQYHLYSVRKDDENMQCLNISELTDFYPLPSYMKDGYQMVQLKQCVVTLVNVNYNEYNWAVSLVLSELYSHHVN